MTALATSFAAALAMAAVALLLAHAYARLQKVRADEHAAERLRRTRRP